MTNESHDLNRDGEIDIFDRQAEQRRLNQEESARAMQEAGAAISQGLRNLGAAFAGLWRNVTSLPGRVLKVARRVRVVARVQVVAEAVADANDLYDRLFTLPPSSSDEEGYRRGLVAVALIRKKTRHDWLIFSEMLDGLQNCEQYPLDAWWLLRGPPPPHLTAPRRRETAPTVEPAMAPMPLLGSVGGAALFTPVTQVMAALLVLAVMFGLWKDGQAKDAARLRDELHDEQTANVGLGKRVIMAEEQVQDLAIERDTIRAQSDARINELQREVERARAARTGKRIKDAQAETRPGGDLGDNDEWLRRNIEPANAAGADAAPGAGGEAGPDPVGVPGQPGG